MVLQYSQQLSKYFPVFIFKKVKLISECLKILLTQTPNGFCQTFLNPPRMGYTVRTASKYNILTSCWSSNGLGWLGLNFSILTNEFENVRA